MIKDISIVTGILAAALFLQTTFIYHYLGIYSVIPDLALLLLVFFSVQQGSIVGQFSGFLAGIVLSMLGNGFPMGFFSIAYLTIGYLFGIGKGNIFFDPLLIPLLVGLFSTIIRNFIMFIVNWVFQLGHPLEDFFGLSLLIESLYNGILAIPVFASASWIKTKLMRGRRGFHG